MATKQSQEAASAEAARKLEEYIEKIHYSDRYSDDEYEYRHVILPKPLFKMIPKQLFNPDKSGTLRLLTEQEWRGIGITQSIGWEHYEVHAPEPHVLLFRRAKNFVAPQQPAQQQVVNGKGKARRK
ncbi:Cyclin-dependent kinases regulatory subunit [Sparassis crispa]|uniref:Cyclin-dependent kinases regulatory subunit n=1 Tax=Sparassis crispa TaxID=139825 RepID=A0A401GHS6_9APHY|nr:Cyclin-dependent kinases regulatory subunit [Sparassis crispa]GBE81708.1 Cyclin-dependent kinases regulatory subunit [Sparassis crispa]